jgi:site-specific recombinase XerD
MGPVETWLGHMGSEQTKDVYRKRLSIFCDWCGFSPEQLLALKDDPNSLEAERLLDRFVASEDFSDWRKLNIVTAVKSFFTYNYKELQKVSGKVSAAKQTPYRTPTAELLRKFINGAWNIRDKALVSFIASTFFREGTIPKLNWGHIENGAILEPDYGGVDILHVGVMGKDLKGGGKGRYVGLEQHAFLTPETRDILLEYKRWRETRDEIITKDTPLFVREVKPYKRISIETVRNIFKAASKRSGVKFSPHDFRRYGQTQLEEARLAPNWIRKILGHKVKGEENPYSRPKVEQLRQAYREALPHLIFIEKGATMEERLKEMEEFKKELEERLGPELYQKGKALGVLRAKKAPKPSEEEIVELRKKLEKAKTETNDGNCANGHNCQQIVSEEELPSLLTQGWRVSAVLPSGKVVVER